MSGLNAHPVLKKYKGISFSWLGFQGKIYAAAIVFGVGILLESALIFTANVTTYHKVQKFYQVQEQTRNEIHTKLEHRLNQSSKGSFVLTFPGWALFISLVIIFLVIIIGWGLLASAVRSIIQPARLMSETFDAAKQKVLNIELPDLSQEGLGRFVHILKGSFTNWNTEFQDSKNSICHFDQLCKELVTEIRKTELFAIQLEKVTEELNDNLTDESRLIESAHKQLTVMMNNSEELQKIPQHLTMIHTDLKNQFIVVQEQIQNILGQKYDVHDESIEITDLAANLKETSQKIKGVISILDDVSERTELLAFNTAIQAARAGDKGLGFGVVAKEIAKLVDYSKKASVQLSNMLSRINGKNEDILGLIHRYAETSSDELPVCDQVSKICNDLFRTAQTNFENIEKLTAVMEILLMKSNQLSDEICQTDRIISEDHIGEFDFDLETLDYQLNVKEANRIALNVSELSQQLRTLAETAATEEDFVY
jgi:methyl-accepting chemotaxis protein